MRTRLRQILAPMVTMLLIVQSLMPGVWAENEVMVQNADNSVTTEVTEEPPVAPVEDPAAQPPVEPSGDEVPPAPENRDPAPPEKPSDPPAPTEPAPVAVWLDNPVLTEATYKNATCDTPPYLNLQPLRDHWAVQKVEISDQWGNVNHNFVLENAAGTTFWIKVTFIDNHVLDANSYWEWNAGPAENEALIKIQFAPAPTDADCTTYLTLPEPTATTEEDDSEVDVDAIAEIDGVASVAVEGDVVAGDDVTVRVAFDHRFGVDTVTSPGWEAQKDLTATYNLTIPEADDADSDEDSTEGDGKTEDGESEGEESSEEGDLSEGDSEEGASDEGDVEDEEAEELTAITLPNPEDLVVDEADAQTATEKVSTQIETIEGVEVVETTEPAAEEAEAGPMMMSLSAQSTDAPETVDVVVTFAEGFTLDVNSSPQWTLQDDGTAIASFQLATPVVSPMSVDPASSGITDFTITDNSVTDFSESVRFNFEYEVFPPSGERLATGDGFAFFLDGFSDIGRVFDVSDGSEIDLIHPDLGIIGYVEIDAAGNGTLVLNEQADNQAGVIGTFYFEQQSHWAEDLQEEDAVTLPFEVQQENKEPIVATLTIPGIPVVTPTPSPDPGTVPGKDGYFVTGDQGRTNTDEALYWDLKAPMGPASQVVMTDTYTSEEGYGAWVFDCADFDYDVTHNPSNAAISVVCDSETITITIGEYPGGENNRPVIRVYSDVIDTNNQANPEDGSLTFRNTVHSEVWHADDDPTADESFGTGTASDEMTQSGIPGEGAAFNPSKSGRWIANRNTSDAAVNPSEFEWTVRAPAGPVDGVILTDVAPAGWAFDCDTLSVSGSASWGAGGANIVDSNCDPTTNTITIEFGPYTEPHYWSTPSFTVRAYQTADQPEYLRDTLSFANTATSETTPWGSEEGATPIPGTSNTVTLTQRPAPEPNTERSKDSRFRKSDNGQYIKDGALIWTITLPQGPNGRVEVTDIAEAGMWIFDCPDDLSTIVSGNYTAATAPVINCDAGRLSVTFPDGYESGRPVITMSASLLVDWNGEAETANVFENTAEIRVYDYLEVTEWGDGTGYKDVTAYSSIDQSQSSGGTGEIIPGEFPVSVGDYIWLDLDRNGAQDAGEPPVPGVTVALLDANGAPVLDGDGTARTTVTDDLGYYEFLDLDSSVQYSMVFTPPATMPAGSDWWSGLPLDTWTTTGGGDEQQDSGWNGTDSNVVPATDGATGTIAFKAPVMGANNGGGFDQTDNPTLDGGLVLPKVSMGNYVWLDNDRDGIQDDNEPGVDGVEVILTLPDGSTRSTTTSDGGYYVFTDLEPNTAYQVEFVKPTGTNWTIQGDAGDMGNDDDSNVDPETGIATFITPANGNNSDVPGEVDLPTIDAGLIPVVSVGDYVWIDTNANGIQDNGETGVGNVTVTLYKGGQFVDATSTDSNGYYAFTDLIPGEEDYHIVFSNAPNGYIWTSQESGNDTAEDSNANAMGVTPPFSAPAYDPGTTTNSAVPGEADDPTIDAGLIKVVSIGNYVWLDENRDGLQDDGEPGVGLARVTISSVGTVEGDPAHMPGKSVLTNDFGYYEFHDLFPGQEYLLTFETPSTGWDQPAYAWTITDALGNTDDHDDGDDSDVTPDSDDPRFATVSFFAPLDGDNSSDPLLVDNPTLDAGLIQAVSVGDYVWIDWNRDGIQNEGAEDGVEGVVVTITNTDGSDPRTLPSVTTNSDGYYWFEDLVPGADYELQFTLPDTVNGTASTGWEWTTQGEGDTTVVDEDSDVDASGRVSFTAPTSGNNRGGAEVTDNPRLDAGIVPLVSVGDYVWIDWDRDGLQDDNEPGVEGATVTLYSIGDDGIVEVGSTTTDADGGYSFTDLDPTLSYQVHFALPDTIEGSEAWVFTQQVGTILDGNNSDANDVLGSDDYGWTGVFEVPTQGNNLPHTSENGADRPEIDAGVMPLVSMGDYVWIDWNRDGLQDDDEPGVEGATVTLYSVDGDVVAEVGSTTTDANGGYSFIDLDPTLRYQAHFELPDTIIGSEAWVFTQQVGTILDGDNSDANAARGTVDYGWTSVFDVPDHGDNQDHNSETGADRPEIDAGVIPLVSVGDYVWIDWNRDGLQDEGEPGVEGATVTLYSVDGDTVSEVGSTTTDANGGYSFTDLDPTVRYQAHFELPETILGSEGWVFTQQVGSILDGDNSDANDARGALDYGWTSVFDVPEHGGNQDHNSETGADRPEIDAGVMPLVSMGDYVWIDNNRDGLQDAGEPGVEGVIVTLHRTDGEDAGVVGTTTTDSDGGYSFVDLDPTGTYRVQFELPTDGDGNIDVLGYQGWMFTEQGEVILDELNSDANADRESAEYGWTAEFTMPEHGDNHGHVSETGVDRPEIDAGIIPLVSIGDYVWDDENRDGIQDPGEPGVPGVKVTITHPDGSTTTKETDENGYYYFDDLIPDTVYPVEFEKPDGYAGWTDPNEGDDPSVDSNVDENGRTSVTTPEFGDNLTDPDETDDPTIDAGLIRLISVGDYVWYDYNRDGIQDEDETPIADVTVTITGPDGFSETKQTDENGYYYFDNLIPETEYTITFEKPEEYTEWTTPNAGDDTAVDSNVDESGSYTFTTPKHGNNLPGPNVTDDPTIDAGLVKLISVGDYVWDDEDRDGVQDPGEPGVPEVTVILYGPDGEEVERTTTDPNGYYNFDDLYPNTEYTIEFEKPDGYAGWTTPNVGDDDSVDSDPDENGRVTFTTPDSGTNLTTPGDADDPTIDAGLVRLISVGDYVWYDADRDGIQDEDETPIAGVTVTITHPDGTTTSTVTDENGYYYFDNLIPETEYTVTFEKPDGYTEWTTPNAGDDTAVDSNVDESGTYTFTTPKHGNNLTGPDATDDPTIDAGLVILVSVGDYVWFDEDGDGIQDPDEPAAPGIVVHIYEGEKIVGTTVTDENGYYAFKDLFPNTEYTIVFEKPEGYSWTQMDAGNDDGADSDVNPFGVVTFTTPATGNNLTDPGMADNPTLDAGLVVTPADPKDPEDPKDPPVVKELPSTGSGSESSALGLMLATVAGLMAAAVALRMNAFKRS